jgi:Mg2+ and Co2+ transporter CorA
MKAIAFDESKGFFEVGIDELTSALPTNHFFWLDVEGASAEEIQRVAAALRIAEPTSSWLPRFGQRPRFEVDAKSVRISTFAATGSGLPTEGHFLYTPSWLLTVHVAAGDSMERARTIFKAFPAGIVPGHAEMLLLILSEFMSSFDLLLDVTDESLSALEDEVLRKPKVALLQQLSVLRKRMWSFHRLWEPQYQASRNLSVAIGAAPKLSNKAELFRDYAERIADLMDRISDLRQRANEAMESYGTSVSNRQSQVINRLTIISAIFLPLTFLTGYFGMNFQWMINRMQSLKALIFLGVGLFLALLTTTLLLFNRMGWLGEGPADEHGTGFKAPLTSGAARTNVQDSGAGGGWPSTPK